MEKHRAGLLVLVMAAAFVIAFSQVDAIAQTQFQIMIDPTAHQTFGLYYPVTYVFQIPTGLSNLSAQYRYDAAGDWTTLPTMTAADIFNGIPAARFDNIGGFAYLSVPFSSSSDSIYMRVLQAGSELPMGYLGVSAYYDNRRAAASISLDDWDYGSGPYFDTALRILTGAHMPATVGIITYGSPNWSLIQSWYDTGYVEPASHTRSHACTADDYLATSYGYSNGYEYQLKGSRDDIKSHLALQYPYVTTFLESCGYTDAQVRQNVVSAGYLAERGYPAQPVQNTFSPWGGDGAYARTLYSIDTEAWWGNETPSLLTHTNTSFDAAYEIGGIYHLVDHPWMGFWYDGSYLNQHITYISNRPDVWYVTFGGLYLYHFVTERGLMNAYAVGNPTPLPTTIITNPPPPHTITKWPGNKKGAVSLTFDDAMPSQVSLAIPALDARGLKGTFFLVPTQADYDQTWDGWRAAAAEGHEMGSHSMTHANLTQISSSALESELQQSRDAIDAQIPIQKCISFAYPFGAYNDAVMSATARYYMAARITGWEDALNYKPYNFYSLLAMGDDYNHRLGYAEAATDEAESKGAWLIFYLHSMDGSGYGSWGIGTLQNYLNYLVTKNLWVGTFGSTMKFVKERDSAALSLVSSSASQIILNLVDTLDDSIFNQPLTIRSEVPSEWSQVSVSQGSSSVAVTSAVEDGKTVVYYEAIPDRGVITLAQAFPGALSSVNVNPTSVTGGATSTGTIILGESAPVGGAVVTLVSSNQAVATVPASLTVAAGNTTATFTVTTSVVSASTAVTITASYGGATRTTTLTVMPVAALTSLSVNPTSVTGGTGSTGTLTLNGPAPGGGVTVALGSDNQAATVPSSVTVAASNTSATFTVTTSAVPVLTAVMITASYSGGTQTAMLTVTPPAPGSLSLNPTSVTGGTSSTGTITLGGPAPADGAVVALNSNNAAATVPASVTVPAGNTNAAFTVTTSPVTVSTAVSITASYGGGSQAASLTVIPPVPASLALNPTSVTGGANSTATVTLNAPAPTGGALVALSSNNAAATVPASVTVAAGNTSATFTVTTSPVTVSTAVSITASYGGGSQAASLTVIPPVPASLALNPTSVTGGANSTATVTLNAPAPTGGALVALSSNNAAATVPASVTVAAGNTSATFTVTTSPVSVSTSVSITAGYGGGTQASSLTVIPPVPASLALNPTSVTGGANSTATVTLNAPAPTGGALVALSSNNPAATVPASVTVAAGNTSATFTATTSPVSVSTAVSITAGYGGGTQASSLTVIPPVPASLALSPTSVTGGANSTATVTLNAPAPTGGALVALSSNNPAATVPASVTVTAGNTSATFTVTTSPVSVPTAVSITASYGGGTQTATLMVTPPALSSLSLSPTSVIGGNNSTGTVTLNAPAPTGGAIVALSSNNAAATVPASVTVAAGNTSATFTVTTSPVSVSTAVSITASYGGATRTSTLTVTPLTLSSLRLSPTSVIGGRTSTGTVTLSSLAPAGGVTVALSSNNAAATAPASVMVPEGSTNATFTVTTSPVLSSTAVTITASCGGVTRTRTLTVTSPTLSSLGLSPTSVIGGTSSTGTVTLSGLAPAGGVTVALSSNNAAAAVPASVLVPAGSTSATFTVTTSAVSASTSVRISASYGSVTRTATMTVRAATLISLGVNPTSVTGGADSTGTVTLSGPAPAGGAVVTLSRNNAAATVPASVTVPAGETSTAFAVTTTHVTTSRAVTITARYAGVSRTARLTVTP